MRRITTYTIAALFAGILTIGAAARAQAPAIVIDSNKLEIGPLLNTGGADSVLVKADKHNFALQVGSKGFVATGVTFLYASLTCTGTRYLLGSPTSLYISYPSTLNSTTNVQGNYSGGVAGTTLYYPNSKTSASKTINSILVVSSSGKGRVCYPLTPTKSTVDEVETFDLSTLPFVPPFSLSF
jgi:hypothetical protein